MSIFNPGFFRRSYFLILLCFLLTSHLTVYSQPGQIVFKHYGVAEGFSSNEAMQIAKTKEGLLWISSGDGLARFDSKTFKFFRHNNKDTHSIAHNYCNAMQVDKRGWIWIAANDDLDIFSPATETFRHIKLDQTKATNTPVKPKAFYYDAVKDIMWVATVKGLYCCKNGSQKLQTAGTITQDTTLTKNLILSITPDGDDWLWLTSANKIIRLHTKTGATETYAVPEMVSGKHNNGTVYIISSYLDKHKTLWLGTFSLGLFSFNTITKKFEQYTYRDITKEENTIGAIIQTGLTGQDDVLFISSAGWGFTAFNTSTKKFTSYKTNAYNSSLGIKGNTYGLHCYDNKLWIGSSTGLHCYDYNLQLFEKKDLSSVAGGVALLPVEHMTIERNNTGKDERLWFFIPYKNGYIYDLLQSKVLPTPAKIQKYTSTSAGVFSLYIDSKNILWISTNQYGLIGYNIKADEIIAEEKKRFYKNREWVNHFFEDSKANLWLCTYNGLFVIDSSRKNIVPVDAVNELIKNDHLSASIAGITEDEYGKIWITADYSNVKNAAIITVDTRKNKASIIYNEQLQNNGNNPAVDIRDICSNKKGKIFVSFRDDNVLWFNSNATGTITFNELGRVQGLNSTAIDQLLSGSSGNIWCSNSFGIAEYKINQNNFSNYTFTDYELNTTNNPAIYISPNSGKFYIGQSNNFLLFNYGNNSNNIKTTNLLFNDLKIYNTLYPQKIKDGARIILNYKQDMISIDFALLSYTNANENTYSWRLEGLEKEWNFSKNNIATYNHLVPGNYTLLVKAANSNGDWKTVPIKLYIKITPAFYTTWWFKLICILLLLALLFWIMQRRIKRIKEQFALRNRIASDLHDEIGSTLTSINILSNVSQQAMDQQPQQAKELLQQISSQSKTIQQNMSDIVWSIRSDNEKIENLVVRIREYAAQTLEPLNINTVIEADDILIAKILPMHYRKDILLICKEAINNIAKHANAGAVKILLTNGNNKISVDITDDGKWKGNNSGTGTKSIHERAKALGGVVTIQATAAGTQVLLLVPLP
jgi:signal transduction histidine kinase/streptogramin lyase